MPALQLTPFADAHLEQADVLLAARHRAQRRAERLSHAMPPHLPTMVAVHRAALLAGSRVQLVPVDDGSVLLGPPPPLGTLADVGAAVTEALRYPLSGPSLEQLVSRSTRVTIVVEPRALPLPGAAVDPRQDALAALVDELVLLGVPAERHTVLVASGLERRSSRPELESLLRPARAREFRGALVVHDCEDERLRAVETPDGRALSVSPALLETDLVVVLTAAETAERGGAAALVGGCDAATIAAIEPGPSLLEPASSPVRELASWVEGAIARGSGAIGVSLVLDHPRLGGRYRGYPWNEETLRQGGRSPLRPAFNALPAAARRGVLQRATWELGTSAVLAGPPSVAHAEALLRGVSLRSAHLEGQLDSLVVPLPWRTWQRPDAPLDPISAAATGLGLALRLWREAPPLREGGTVVLLHDFHAAFARGHSPFRTLFQALRDGRERTPAGETRGAVLADRQALSAYRAGRAPHPLLAHAEWASCGPALARCGRVIVAGCRDAAAARALGFVPSHSVRAAIEMARGVAGGAHRLGVLLAPPYAPIVTT